MKRHTLILAAAAVLMVVVGVWSSPVRAADPGEAQDLVERARLAYEEIIREENFGRARAEMKTAKAVFIVPRLFKAGFIFGGEGGSGILIARRGDGSWGYPAFYTMGGGSIGLQIGVQDSQVLFIIRNDGGLKAVLEDQVKLGADVSVTAGSLGAGMEASTTTSMGADIVSFSLARGAFGGGAFEGSVIAKRSDLNAQYYGSEIAPRDIVMGNTASNPAADMLREALARQQ
ncbi:MAG: lipid-binding SYLF domain-containing protein [Rhodospirillales bacterium]|nr:lipid-binding SYLF domain-containing protein [Rhodospirillales bacterium]